MKKSGKISDSRKFWEIKTLKSLKQYSFSGGYVFTEEKKNNGKSVLCGWIFTKQTKKQKVFRKFVKTFPKIHIELVWKL